MITVVIAAHGNLSESLIGTARMIFGNMENVEQVNFKPEEGIEHLIARYTAATEKVGGNDSVLFLVDLFGGSPYNAASRFVAHKENMDIVTGVNLPMVVEVLGKRLMGGTLEDLVQIAKHAGVDGIKSFREIFSHQEMANCALEEKGDVLG